MPRDIDGVYTPPRDWEEDAQNGVPFDPAKWNEQDQDYAEALNDLPLKTVVPTWVAPGTDPATVNPGSLMEVDAVIYVRPASQAIWLDISTPGIQDIDSHTHEMVDVIGLTAALAAKAALDSPAFEGNPTAPNQAASSNNTRIANTAYVDGAVGALALLVSGALVFKGAWDASSGSFPGSGAAQTGFFYKVSVAGTVDGMAFSVGDDVFAITDNAATSTYAGNWLKVEGSITSSEVIAALGFTPQAHSAALDAYPDPATDGGDSLGTVSARWTGVYLTAAGVINFNNGNATITHSTNALAFGVGGNEVFRIDSSKRLGLGTTAPTSKLTVSDNGAAPPTPLSGTVAHVVGADDTDVRISIDGFGSTTPNLGFRRARGSNASKSAIQQFDILANIGAAGYGATGYGGGRAQILIYAAENWTDSAQGAFAMMRTTPNGAASPVESMRWTESGHVQPGADNAFTFGTAMLRWSTLYAATGTINTSDQRDKDRVASLTGEAAVSMVDAVEPQLFRFKVGGYDIRPSETETVPDDDGSPIPKMVPVPRAGQRVHAGFFAQDIKAAMSAADLDFAAWGLDNASDADSRQWLRPDQLIPVLWAALRETRAELAQLKSQVEGS